jgi:exopolysaccharide biosynthesis polyprenyl glycosylphosphotransferase
MAQARKQNIFFIILFPDIVLLYLSLWLSVQIRFGGELGMGDWTSYLRAFSIIYAVWLVVFFIHGLFELASFRRYTFLIVNLASAMAINVLAAVLYFYLQPSLILTPRRFLAIDAAVAFGLILLWHLLIKYLIKNRIFEGVYLFSFNNELSGLERDIQKHNYLGFRVLGHLNEQSLMAGQNFSKNVGIVLPDNLNAKPEVLKKFYELRTSGVNFYNYKDFYENLLRRIYLSELNEMWFLENINYREKRFYNLVKRVVDLIVGLLSAVVFAVTFPICALLIYFSSSGAIFFVQERVGKNDKLFKVYKYRTMTSFGPTNTWTSVNDPRITGVGKFLRKSRIDELPQFINLLLGNMSLVGPRPEQPRIVEELKTQIPFYDERHLVKPGLTGWAQINNVYAASLEETRLKLQYDLYYIKHRSFLFDSEIILKTLYYIFTWQGR